MERHFASAAVVLALGASVAGCADPGPNPIQAAFAARPKARGAEASVAFRFPAAGGAIRVYRMPRLAEVAWRIEAPGLTARSVLGFSADEGQIYLITPRSALLALDLGTGRSRLVDSSISLATLGPTGMPHTIKLDGSVGAVERRNPVPWGAQIPSGARDLWGGGRGRLLVDAVTDQGRELLVVTAGQPPERQPLPDGPAAAARWGDLVVVATDSGLVEIQPGGGPPRTLLRMGRSALAVAISPSGHRIYLALRGGTLMVVERYQGEVLARLTLPGEADALRPDPLGRSLLLKSVTGDSVWVVNLSRSTITGHLSAPWGPDLPAVAPDGSILLRRRSDVLALSPDSLQEVGRVAGAANDRWLAVGWDPRRPNVDLGDQASEAAPGPTSQRLYLQVSSTSNQAWADDLAKNLRSAGMNASVLQPSESEENYRVVIGPFPTREAAEDTGRKLGRPFWIFSPDPDQPTQ